jgi:hypothetical protein
MADKNAKRVNIARSHIEAEAYDIQQYIEMTPDDRLAAAKVLRERVYGRTPPDIRHRRKNK